MTGDPPEVVNATSKGYRLDFGEGTYVDNIGKKYTYDADGNAIGGNQKTQISHIDGKLYYKQTDMKVKVGKLNKLSDAEGVKYVLRKDDTIKSADGDDTLVSWAGDDKIKAGAGNDILNGWKGNDKLFGQEGNDDFYFAKGYDMDTVKDFNRKADKIVIDKNLASKYKHLEKAASEYKKGLMLDFGKGDVLKIEGAKMKDLETKVYFNAEWDL